MNTFDPDCLLSAGIEGIILGCQQIGIAYSMAQKAKAAHLPLLGTYAYLYFASAEKSTKDAIMVAQAYGAPRVWLDVEDVSEIKPDISDRIAIVQRCVDLVESAGLMAGIYTGSWYWIPDMGNTTQFSRLPLWHSAYLDYNGTPYQLTSVNYGGWTDLAVHQWTSTLPVCGRNRDANHYYLEDDAMTPAEVEAIFNKKFDDALGPGFLSLLEQMLGIKQTTFDAPNQVRVDAILNALGALTGGTPPPSRVLTIKIPNGEVVK